MGRGYSYAGGGRDVKDVREGEKKRDTHTHEEMVNGVLVRG